MPTIQEIIDEVDLTYRNTYTPEQKIKWMDAVQRQIFQVVPKESPPYVFTTVAGFSFYALPEDCDRFGIKEVTIERAAGTEKYDTLPYISIESNQEIGETSKFYSVLQDQILINPLPNADSEGKKVYVIYNHRPAQLNDPDSIPELEEDFHELLTLGVLERVARARGEIEDKNNFANDYNLLFRQYKEIYKLRQPEYYKINDVLPRRRGSVRSSRVSDLIPRGH